MSPARALPVHADPVLTPAVKASIWMRVLRLIGIARRGDLKPAQVVAPAVRFAGRLAALSAQGIPAPRKVRPARAVLPASQRRPGLQNRWKPSDRVAL